MNIIFVRHPQTTANKQHIIYGKSDYPYTKRGEKQFHWVKDYIVANYDDVINDKNRSKIKIISSPRDRALKLAKDMSHTFSIGIESNENIKEMDFGIFEGLTIDEAVENYPKDYLNFQNHFDTTRIPQGESYDEFISRIDAFLDYVMYLNNVVELDEVIIVSHGAVIRELFERLLDLSPGDSWKFTIGNGSIIKLVLKDEGYRLEELVANKF